MRYFVEVKIKNAEKLMSADVNGFSDPYCVAYIRDFEGAIVNPLTRATTSTLKTDCANTNTSSTTPRRRSFDLAHLRSKVESLTGLQTQNYHHSRIPGKRQTQIVKKNLNPVWNETMVLETSASPTSDALVIEVWDYDKVTNDDWLGSVSIQLSSCVLGERQLYKQKLTGNGITSGVLEFEIRAQNFPEPRFSAQKSVMLCVDHPHHFRLEEALYKTEERFFPDVQTALAHAKKSISPDIFVLIVAVRIDPINIEDNEELKRQLCGGEIEAYQHTVLTSKNRVLFDRSNTAIYGPLEYGTKRELQVSYGVTNMVFKDVTFSAAGTSKKETKLFIHPDAQVHLIGCTVKGSIVMHNSTCWIEGCTIENLSNKAAITIGEIDEKEERSSYISNTLSPVITETTILGNGKDDIGILLQKFTFATPDNNSNLLDSYRDVEYFHASDFGSILADNTSICRFVFRDNKFVNCNKQFAINDVEGLTDSEMQGLLATKKSPKNNKNS